jgi:hypothetical protein
VDSRINIRGPTAFLVFIALFVPTFLIRLVNLGKFTAKLFDPEKAKKILEDIVAGRPVSAGGPSLPNHE